MSVKIIKPSTTQLITLIEIELELMVLNAKVRCGLESYDVDDEMVMELRERYSQLGEQYTLFLFG